MVGLPRVQFPVFARTEPSPYAWGLLRKGSLVGVSHLCVATPRASVMPFASQRTLWEAFRAGWSGPAPFNGSGQMKRDLAVPGAHERLGGRFHYVARA